MHVTNIWLFIKRRICFLNFENNLLVEVSFFEGYFSEKNERFHFRFKIDVRYWGLRLWWDGIFPQKTIPLKIREGAGYVPSIRFPDKTLKILNYT